jgi:zinc protease
MKAATDILPASPADIKIVQASCGVEAWLVRSELVPLIAVSFIMSGGGAQDDPHKAGTAQLMASLLDEGAGPYSSDQFQEKLADNAIELNFSAGADSLSGSLKTLTKNADEAFELLRLALTNPHFDVDAIERVRAQSLAGLRHQAKDSGAMASKRFLTEAFPDHAYGRKVSGSLESVSLITRDDIAGAARSMMARSTLKVAVVGAIDEEALKKVLDHVFGGLPEQPDLMPVPPISLAHLGERFICDLDVPQSVIRFGLGGVARHDQDFIPFHVFNHILGGGSFTSRLFQEVREKRGLAYSVGTSAVTQKSTAYLAGYTATKNERVYECLDVINDEVAKILDKGITDEELKAARDYLIGSYALSFDTSSKIAGQLAHIAFEDLGSDYITRRNTLIAKVTHDDITRAAKNALGAAKPLVVIAGRPV